MRMEFAEVDRPLTDQERRLLAIYWKARQTIDFHLAWAETAPTAVDHGGHRRVVALYRELAAEALEAVNIDPAIADVTVIHNDG